MYVPWENSCSRQIVLGVPGAGCCKGGAVRAQGLGLAGGVGCKDPPSKSSWGSHLRTLAEALVFFFAVGIIFINSWVGLVILDGAGREVVSVPGLGAKGTQRMDGSKLEDKPQQNHGRGRHCKHHFIVRVGPLW